MIIILSKCGILSFNRKMPGKEWLVASYLAALLHLLLSSCCCPDPCLVHFSCVMVWFSWLVNIPTRPKNLTQ